MKKVKVTILLKTGGSVAFINDQVENTDEAINEITLYLTDEDLDWVITGFDKYQRHVVPRDNIARVLIEVIDEESGKAD